MDTMSSWENRDNVSFYEILPIEGFQEIASVCGLDTCCDVSAILSHLIDASSILEIGSGYGRVLSFLQNIGLKGKLFGLEVPPCCLASPST